MKTSQARVSTIAPLQRCILLEPGGCQRSGKCSSAVPEAQSAGRGKVCKGPRQDVRCLHRDDLAAADSRCLSRFSVPLLPKPQGEVQKLLGVIDTSTHTGLRDRALLGALAYTFARIGAVVNLKVEDYYPSGKRFLLRFKEKGGKEKELPVHHKLKELLDQYLKATGLDKEPESPLFPASIGKTGKLSRRPLVRTDAANMLKRRLKQAGLPAHYSPHSFRATGITNFLENDGTLEAAAIASRKCKREETDESQMLRNRLVKHRVDGRDGGFWSEAVVRIERPRRWVSVQQRV
jgi:integrase